MAPDPIFTIQSIRVALDMAQRRAEIAGRNIANADVAGYQAQRVDFSDVVAQLQSATASGGNMDDLLPADAGRVFSTGAPVRLDAEVTELVAAGTAYQTLVEAANRHMGLLRLAASARG